VGLGYRRKEYVPVPEEDRSPTLGRPVTRVEPPLIDVSEPRKVCRACETPKPLTAYYRNKTAADGRDASCKACKDAKNKEWVARNWEQRKRVHYEWLQRHPEKGSEYYHRMKARDIRGYLLKACTTRARTFGHVVSITREDIVIPEFCPLLGLKLQFNEGSVRPNSPSLDRIDSRIGYIRGNVWVISHRANTLKNCSTVEELEMIAKNLRAKLESMR
jgi:hypothetical protein